MGTFQVTAVGRVSSTLSDMQSAPRQPDEGAPDAWLIFDEQVSEALRNINQVTRSSCSPGSIVRSATC